MGSFPFRALRTIPDSFSFQTLNPIASSAISEGFESMVSQIGRFRSFRSLGMNLRFSNQPDHKQEETAGGERRCGPADQHCQANRKRKKDEGQGEKKTEERISRDAPPSRCIGRWR